MPTHKDSGVLEHSLTGKLQQRAHSRTFTAAMLKNRKTVEMTQIPTDRRGIHTPRCIHTTDTMPDSRKIRECHAWYMDGS